MRISLLKICFNTQPPEGGCQPSRKRKAGCRQFQHTAARRRLSRESGLREYRNPVSTHSRPKAAVYHIRHIQRRRLGFQHTAARRRLSAHGQSVFWPLACFNTQPPEGGCLYKRFFNSNASDLVSTHSRPKAAVCLGWQRRCH